MSCAVAWPSCCSETLAVTHSATNPSYAARENLHAACSHARYPPYHGNFGPGRGAIASPEIRLAHLVGARLESSSVARTLTTSGMPREGRGLQRGSYSGASEPP